MMNMLKNRILILIVSFLLIVPSLLNAASLFGAGNVIWEAGNNVFVKYADQDRSGFGENDHPVELDQEELRVALESLEIQEQDNGDSVIVPSSVFSGKQISLLAQHLADGLKNAQPDQDIIFALEKSVRRLFGLKAERLFVAGRVFYKNGKLNLILGDHNRPRDKAYEAAYDPTHVGIVRYDFDHGQRSKPSKGFNHSIIKVNGIANKQLETTRRNNWFVIDVTAAAQAHIQQASMRETEQLAAKRKELREILGDDATRRPSTATPSLEERLITLKQLKDKDLVTEQEYVQKRKQLLDEL